MTGTDAINNMTGFDFANTWRTVTNPDGYPILAWEKGGSGTILDAYRNQQGNVDLQGLQQAIEDFTNNRIDLSTLQNVIDEFIS